MAITTPKSIEDQIRGLQEIVNKTMALLMAIPREFQSTTGPYYSLSGEKQDEIDAISEELVLLLSGKLFEIVGEEGEGIDEEEDID